jgi:hypothetical protein
MPDEATTETASDVDTGSADSVSQETSHTETASPDTASSATDDSATAANPDADGNAGSLETGAEATDTNAAPKQTAQPQKTEDWKRRHDGQLQANQRLSGEKKRLEEERQQLQARLQEFEQKLNGIDLQKVRSFQEHQQKAANPIWHPSNPEHARFQEAKRKHDFYVGLTQRSAPEDRAKINEWYNADLSADDQAMIQKFTDHGRQEQMRFQMDPEGYLRERLDKLVDQKLNGFQEKTVGSYRQNLEERQRLGETLQKYPELNKPEVLQRAMQMVGEGRDMHDALRDIRMEFLEQRLSGVDKARRSVEEKERLLQGNNSISRDPAASTHFDLFAEAKKLAIQRGITNPSDARFMRVVDELRKKHNIKD